MGSLLRDGSKEQKTAVEDVLYKIWKATNDGDEQKVESRNNMKKRKAKYGGTDVHVDVDLDTRETDLKKKPKKKRKKRNSSRAQRKHHNRSYSKRVEALHQHHNCCEPLIFNRPKAGENTVEVNSFVVPAPESSSGLKLQEDVNLEDARSSCIQEVCCSECNSSNSFVYFENEFGCVGQMQKREIPNTIGEQEHFVLKEQLEFLQRFPDLPVPIYPIFYSTCLNVDHFQSPALECGQDSLEEGKQGTEAEEDFDEPLFLGDLIA